MLDYRAVVKTAPGKRSFIDKKREKQLIFAINLQKMTGSPTKGIRNGRFYL